MVTLPSHWDLLADGNDLLIWIPRITAGKERGREHVAVEGGWIECGVVDTQCTQRALSGTHVAVEYGTVQYDDGTAIGPVAFGSG